MQSKTIKICLVPVMTVSVVVVAVLLLGDGWPIFRGRTHGLNPEQLEWIRETHGLIQRSYVEETDAESLVYSALEGMIKSLDGYCDFIGPEDKKGYEERTKGEHRGIGLTLVSSDQAAVVLFPHPGSPAEKAGLLPGDRLLEIDGLSLAGKGSEEVQGILRSRPGELSLLSFERPSTGKRRTVEIEHAMIMEPSVFGERMLDRDGKIGYLRIKGFNNGTPNELTRAIQELKDSGARALVIDMRFNGGGLLEKSLDAANLFVGEGILLRTQGRHPESNRSFPARPSLLRFPDIPLALLVNGSTASAAEVFAGTLQDHERAVLVGMRTFGKGVVQTAMRRSFGHDVIIKLTTARYYTPLGRCIEKELANGKAGPGGLEPDHKVPCDEQAVRELKAFLKDREIPTAYLEPALGARSAETIRDVQLDEAVRVLAAYLDPVFRTAEKR